MWPCPSPAPSPWLLYPLVSPVPCPLALPVSEQWLRTLSAPVTGSPPAPLAQVRPLPQAVVRCRGRGQAEPSSAVGTHLCPCSRSPLALGPSKLHGTLSSLHLAVPAVKGDVGRGRCSVLVTEGKWPRAGLSWGSIGFGLWLEDGRPRAGQGLQTLPLGLGWGFLDGFGAHTQNKTLRRF